MKKNLILISSILALIMLAGCASAPEAAPVVVKEEPKMDTNYPSWFLSPPKAEDVIYGLGLAKLGSTSLSKDTAVARARTDIAFQVSSRVKASLDDYAQDAGMDGNSQFIQMVESVSNQTANVELRNAVTEELFPAEDGTWYAMVSYPKAEFEDEVGKIFARNEDAAFAEFKADEALRRLKADLDEEPLQSSVKPE